MLNKCFSCSSFQWTWWNVTQKALKELYIIFSKVVFEILYSMFNSNFETYMLIIHVAGLQVEDHKNAFILKGLYLIFLTLAINKL